MNLRAMSSEHLKLSAMGPMVKISEAPGQESSASSCTSESLSDKEHELDKDMPFIKSQANKMHKSLTLVDNMQNKLVPPKATAADKDNMDVDSCFQTT